jgi:hypothetical protein
MSTGTCITNRQAIDFAAFDSGLHRAKGLSVGDILLSCRTQHGQVETVTVVLEEVQIIQLVANEP